MLTGRLVMTLAVAALAVGVTHDAAACTVDPTVADVGGPDDPAEVYYARYCPPAEPEGRLHVRVLDSTLVDEPDPFGPYGFIGWLLP